MQAKKKILAVDDNKLNIDIIKEALGDDYNLRTALTGEEALEIAVDFEPDIILLDVMMPGIDGYEVCRRLRANTAFDDTTIIMVTAKGELSERVKGHEVGTDDYITKPFKEDELRESVDFFLHRSVSSNNNS